MIIEFGIFLKQFCRSEAALNLMTDLLYIPPESISDGEAD